jgi:hypothetical protein
LKDLRVDGRIILNLSSKSELGKWIALIWLKIRRDGGLMQML